MQITVELSEKETVSLQRLMDEGKAVYLREWTMEDAIHECIKDSMFDKGEQFAEEEFEG